MTIRITCPTCKKPTTFDKENIYRPFCSDRCKLIDLGDWASENHKLPGPNIDFTQEEDDSDL